MDDKNAEPEVEQIQVLPLVALRETVIFPEMIVPLQVGRDRSVKALDRAVRTSQPVALITQRSIETEEVNSVDELYPIGTLAKIAQVIRLQDGTIRAIAITSAERLPALPEVPTFAATVPGYEVSFWGGLMAPRGTPEPILERLNREVDAVLRLPDVAARVRGFGSPCGYAEDSPNKANTPP